MKLLFSWPKQIEENPKQIQGTVSTRAKPLKVKKIKNNSTQLPHALFGKMFYLFTNDLARRRTLADRRTTCRVVYCPQFSSWGSRVLCESNHDMGYTDHDRATPGTNLGNHDAEL